MNEDSARAAKEERRMDQPAYHNLLQAFGDGPTVERFWSGLRRAAAARRDGLFASIAAE